MIRSMSFAIALVTATSVFAQTPTPSPPPAPKAAKAIVNVVQKTFNPGDLVVLDGSQSSAKAFSWAIVPASPNFWIPPGSGSMAAFSSGSAGEFTVLLSVASGDTIDTAEQIVTIGAPAPPPTPTPPDPPVPPTPVAKNLWLVAVDDATQRTPQTAALLGDLTYWAKVTAAGHKRAFLDLNNPAAASYLDLVKQAGGAPALVLLDAATNKVLAAVKLPADTAGVDALISKFTAASASKQGK